MQISRVMVTALLGVYMLSSGVQAWFLGRAAPWFLRIALVAAALLMISGGLVTDIIGIALGLGIYLAQNRLQRRPGTSHA